MVYILHIYYPPGIPAVVFPICEYEKMCHISLVVHTAHAHCQHVNHRLHVSEVTAAGRGAMDLEGVGNKARVIVKHGDVIRLLKRELDSYIPAPDPAPGRTE